MILPFCIERCLGTSGPLSSQTEEGKLQKHPFHAFVPDPAPLSQPEHGTNDRAHSLHQEEAGPSLVAPCHHSEEEGLLPPHPIVGEKEVPGSPPTMNDGIPQDTSILNQEPLQPSHGSVDHQPSHSPSSNRTLAQAIQNYLEDQKRHHRRPKTLEWHEQALGLFQRYLLTEHQCTLVDQITDQQIHGWIATLPLIPTATGALRSPNTVESYGRSARAFCHWLVLHRYLSATPFAHLQLPPAENRSPLPLEPEEWEHLLLACHSPKETGVIANQAAARNRAILWMLFETGMHVTEICRLCLGDVDREQGMVRVQGKGGTVRWLTLGHEGRRSLLAYLDAYRLKPTTHCKQGGANTEPLFLSETGHPLTKGAIGLLFGRLRERVAGSPKTISASLLRKNFAVRYLQTGGDQSTLRELLGQQKSVIVKCSVGRNDEMMDPPKTEGKSRGMIEVLQGNVQSYASIICVVSI